MTTVREVDLGRPAFKADPYPFYARLCAEAPVCPLALTNGRSAWLVTRYDDVVALFKDERFVNEGGRVRTPEQEARQPWVPKAFRRLQRNLLALDAPDHTRLRTLVHKAFTPRLIENMQERIRSLADELLDAVEARGRMDVIRDFALPLPTTIIAEMLGVPARDRSRFHRWSNALVSSTSSLWGTLKTLPHVMAFLRYIGKLVKARQAAPQEDLASALVMAHEAGDRLSEDELVAMIFLLLVAGHETTVNLIGNGVLALLEHTGQMERLRDDPGLIRPAVEEFLRYDPPVHLASERYAREDVTLGGVTIGAARWSTPCSDRPTGTSGSSSAPMIWTSPGSRTVTSPSGRACITASGRRWRGWRDRSPSTPSCAGCRSCASPCRGTPSAGAPAWGCTAWRRCRWRFPGAVPPCFRPWARAFSALSPAPVTQSKCT